MQLLNVLMAFSKIPLKDVIGNDLKGRSCYMANAGIVATLPYFPTFR